MKGSVLPDFPGVLWKAKGFIFAVVLLTVLMVWVLDFLQPPVYQATGYMHYKPLWLPEGKKSFPSDLALMREFARSLDVLNQVLEQLGEKPGSREQLLDLAGRVFLDLENRQADGKNYKLLIVRSRGENPGKTARTVQILMEALAQWSEKRKKKFLEAEIREIEKKLALAEKEKTETDQSLTRLKKVQRIYLRELTVSALEKKFRTLFDLQEEKAETLAGLPREIDAVESEIKKQPAFLVVGKNNRKKINPVYKELTKLLALKKINYRVLPAEIKELKRRISEIGKKIDRERVELERLWFKLKPLDSLLQQQISKNQELARVKRELVLALEGKGGQWIIHESPRKPYETVPTLLGTRMLYWGILAFLVSCGGVCLRAWFRRDRSAGGTA